MGVHHNGILAATAIMGPGTQALIRSGDARTNR
jgi:hypothetical protein